MKICIVGASNLINMSLISIYTHVLELNGIQYDLVYWDRAGLDEKSNANHLFKYEEKISDNDSKLKKLFSYSRFRQYIKRILKKEKYDVVILWQTTTAYILYDILMHSYKNKYILNVRDYVAELKFPCVYMIKKMVKHALLCTISSEGFKKFLPIGQYQLIHSINEELDYRSKLEPKSDGKIKIGFVGSVRYLRENFRLIDNLANDDRFELWYCGARSENVQEYVDQRKYNNIFTTGRFMREETTEIMDGFNIINSAFGNDALDNSTLTPIRLFTALALHKPVIVSKGSYLADLVEKNKIGLVIDTRDETLGDYIYSYYTALNRIEFNKRADLFIEQSLQDNRKFENKLLEILKQ